MTIERRIIVGIEDIKGVCFKCLSCGLRHTLPPDKIGDVPLKCPRCQNTWIGFPPVGHGAAASPFVDFTSSIERIRALDKEDGIKPGFRVLLEFDEPRG